MRWLLIFVLFWLLCGSLAYSQDCPSCGFSMMWTGKTQIEWGKILRLYKCTAGHLYWQTPEQYNTTSRFQTPGYGESSSLFQTPSYNDTSSFYSSDLNLKCPICSLGVTWTGETRIEWGKLQKIYSCPAGHKSVK